MKKISKHYIPKGFEKQEILPAIAQDEKTKEVLMVAYMNKEAYKKTLESGKAHYFSRSRNRLWMKGEESGHTQTVKKVFVDCDEDTVLLTVKQENAACHTGYKSCFFSEVLSNGTTAARGRKLFNPDKVYGSKKK